MNFPESIESDGHKEVESRMLVRILLTGFVISF
jgi:hypothetical protein